MEKWWYWVLVGFIYMFATGMLLGVIYDKLDWIGLFVVIGFIIIYRKLNEIHKLLQGKKKK